MKGDRSAQLRILTIPLDYNKVYALVGEDGLVLIDSGPDFVGAWDEIVGALRRAGFEAKHVQSVLLTHAHPDHSSLAARWQHDVGAEIVAPRGEEPALLLGPEFVPSQREVVRGFLLRHGVPAEALEGRGEAAFLSPSLLGGPQDHRRGVDQEVEELEAEHGRRHRRKLAWRTPLRMTAVQPDTLLDDGDVVERCGVTLQTIVCPGHTPANTVYWHEPSGTLFSGDHILSRVTPNPGIHFPDGASRMRSLPAYVRSLQRVRSLPAREVLPGHGEEMSDLPGAIERLLAHHEHRAGRIEAMLLERPHTAYEVMLRIFPRVGPERLRQAMAEIVGHLDLLVEQGVAVELDDGGVVHYRGHSRRPIADLRGTAT